MPSPAVAATASPLLGLSSGPGESPAAAIADKAEQTAQARFADLYVGEVLTDNGSHAVVYLTQLQQPAEAAIVAGTQPGVISFARAPRSLAYLNALNDAVTSKLDALQQQGTTIVTWGPDFVTGREDVTVQNLDPARTSVLDQTFGASNLVLSSTPLAYTGIALSGRASDSPPWNGGDYTIIHLTGGTADCTSGFGTSGGGKQYLLEAAHCAPKGAKVYNGSPSGKGREKLMGTVSTQGNWGSKGGLDAELIKTSGHGGSSAVVFTGRAAKPSRSVDSGSASSRRGDQVCDDGAFEGEICDLIIQNSMPTCTTEALSVVGPFYKVCGLWLVKKRGGGIVAGEGDSGGPVFRFVNNELKATGSITLAHGKVINCPGGHRGCYRAMYYTSISRILKEFKVRLKI